MKFIWILVVAICTLKFTDCKSLRDDVSIVKNNISTKSNVSSHHLIVSKRQSIGLFPSLTYKVNKPITSWKPVIKLKSQENKVEKRKPVMRKLEIKNVNRKENDMLRTKATTRRPVMKIRKITRKPHQVYSETVREKYVLNRNGTIDRNNSEKRHRNILNHNYRTNKEVSSENRANDFKKIDISSDGNDSDEYKKDADKNDNAVASSRKSKIMIIFPRRNRTLPLTNTNNEIHVNSSEYVQLPSRVLTTNNQSTENKTKEADLNIIPEVQTVTVTAKPEDIDQEKTLLKDFIPVKGDENQKPGFEPKIQSGKDEITTDSRPKRRVNIIEEEMVATSYPRSKITSREFVVNYDLKFKNIHS